MKTTIYNLYNWNILLILVFLFLKRITPVYWCVDPVLPCEEKTNSVHLGVNRIIFKVAQVINTFSFPDII